MMNIVEAFGRNTLEGVAAVVSQLLTIYFWILLIAVLISWVRPDPYNPIVIFLRRATEPVLGWVRRKMPFAVIGGLDLSPIVVFLAIELARFMVVGTLITVARGG